MKYLHILISEDISHFFTVVFVHTVSVHCKSMANDTCIHGYIIINTPEITQSLWYFSQLMGSFLNIVFTAQKLNGTQCMQKR